MSLKENDIAPNFSLPVSGDSVVKLDDFIGKKCVLFFYPKDNTPGCTREAKDFSQLLPEFKNYNTEVFGISRDDISSHKKFESKYGLQIKLLSDSESVMCKDYNVLISKSMFGKEYLCISRTTFLISEDQKILKIWNNVKVRDHAQEVLKYIKSI